MKRIIFESAPEFTVLCILLGLAYASAEYLKVKHPWGRNLNWLLFGFRAALVSFLAFLLLGPIVKQVNNLFEKPVFVILHDNSSSVKEAIDSTVLRSIGEKLVDTKNVLAEKGYQVSVQNLEGKEIDNEPFQYKATASDINGALKSISNRYEGKNIAGVLLISDGLYNAGLSPLYSSYNFPVHTVGVGDTTPKADISIKNIAYNKISYQGNKFPLRAEVHLKNLDSQPVTVSLYRRGRLIDKQTKNSTQNQIATFDFQPSADEQGIQKYDIHVMENPNERNTRNNYASVFVEVVAGKKKILLVAPAPHPDIKALRDVIGQNSNYEFLLHIPGIHEQQANILRSDEIDLVIFDQAPDIRGKTRNLFQSFLNKKTALFLIVGQQSDLPLIVRQNLPLKFEAVPRDYDEVTPGLNPTFTSFTLSAEASTIISGYPPVSVHYGKIQNTSTTTTLLFQRVGSVATDKPLLSVSIDDSRKIAMMLGEGLWRWRLNEFDRTEKTETFDELFGKLIQFLSTAEDKRKFRSYPVKQEFSDTEPVVFESQVYNDIFEPVYGNTIEIEITDDNGKKRNYTYVTSPGNIRYQIGGLQEGVYRYRAKTTINNKTEHVRGEFAAVKKQIELQNLTADFDLLRRLSSNTGGRFFSATATDALKNYLNQRQAQSVIHSEETYNSIINLKWVFWLLLILVTVEWALRKYFGSY